MNVANVKENVKSKVSVAKNRLALAGTTAVVTLMSAAPVFAGEGESSITVDEAVKTALTDGLGGCVDSFLSIMLAIIPIALSVFTVKWVIKNGFKFFKTSTNG